MKKTWLHYYNKNKPALPSAGSLTIEYRYGAHYCITMGGYKRAMMKIREKDPDAKIAFRGPANMVGEPIGVVTYQITNAGRVPEVQIIGSVEGVY